MDEYAGRILADRYRLPLPPSDEYELAETRAYDTYSGQEVLVRQVPLPEVVEAEVLDADGLPEGFVARDGGVRRASARTTRRPTEPAVRRAIEAAQAAAQIPDHPRLDQVFDVFAEGGSLWIVSELVAARRLDALLAERPLSPYRAAEIASDVLAALRVLHAHGWVHRNITVRTVLVCDDGRVMLTGLAAGAAEEALCGYDPVPVRDFEGDVRGGGAAAGGSGGPGGPGGAGTGLSGGAGGGASHGFGPGGASGLSGALGGGAGGAGGAAAGGDPEAARRAAIEARAKRGGPAEAAAGVGPRALEARGPEGPAALEVPRARVAPGVLGVALGATCVRRAPGPLPRTVPERVPRPACTKSSGAVGRPGLRRRPPMRRRFRRSLRSRHNLRFRPKARRRARRRRRRHPGTRSPGTAGSRRHPGGAGAAGSRRLLGTVAKPRPRPRVLAAGKSRPRGLVMDRLRPKHPATARPKLRVRTRSPATARNTAPTPRPPGR